MKYLLRALCVLLIAPLVFANSAVQVMTEEYPPYSYLDSKGNVAGTVTQIVEEILQSANINYQINLVPWARAYEATIKKPNTLIYPIVFLDSRKDKFHFICPVSHINDFYFFKLHSRTDIAVTNLAEAKKYVTGVVRNDSIHHFLQKSGFEKGKHLDIAVDDIVTLKKLQHGRVDLIYTSKASMAPRLKVLGLTEQSVTPLFQIPEFKEQPLCIGVNKQTDPALLQKLKAAHQNYMRTHSGDSPAAQ